MLTVSKSYPAFSRKGQVSKGVQRVVVSERQHSCHSVKTSNIATTVFDILSRGAMHIAQANLIRRDRFHLGEMTQKRLADLSGVNRQTINALERNKVSLSLEIAFGIARAFPVRTRSRRRKPVQRWRYHRSDVRGLLRRKYG